MRTACLLLLALSATAQRSASQCTLVADIVPGSGSSTPSFLTAAFGRDLYFTAQHPVGGASMFRWSPGGGVQRIDLQGNGPGGPDRYFAACTSLGPRVFFNGFRSGRGRELWMTDGTPAGTVEIKDIRPGTGSSLPWQFASLGERVMFSASDGFHGAELWISDGTASGTSMVLDIYPGSRGSAPLALVPIGDRIVFTASSPTVLRELWVTDGTAAGTRLLRDFSATGSGFSGRPELVAFGGQVWFAADDSVLGSGLWRTDGTPGGTVMVSDKYATDLTPCGDWLFFSGGRTLRERELWKTDGTPAGTVMVKDIRPGFFGSEPREITCAGNRVFFAAYQDGVIGQELWVSDGTPNGTQLVKDLEPGPPGSAISMMFAAGDGVCFRASVANDTEIWFSDGTANGTRLVCDVDPNASSQPEHGIMVFGRLFFVASHPTAGRELMALPTPGATWTSLRRNSVNDRATLVVRDGAPPVLGRTIVLEADGPPGHLAFLLASPSLEPAPTGGALMSAGCNWVGALTPLSTVLATSSTPDLTLALPVPAQPALEGLVLNFQAGFADLASQPPLKLSNGLQLVLGTAAPH